MIEGENVYLCDKKEKRGKIYLELQDNREIKSNGEDLEQCKVDICSQIILWNGDGEAVLEFIPEKTKKTDTGIEMYRSLGYNETVDILNENNLFTGGVCKKCLYGIGERTDELLNLEWKPKNVLASVKFKNIKNDHDFPRVFPKIQIYSKNFIELLSKNEKKLFLIKEVHLKGKKSNFVELIPRKVILQSGHVGAKYPIFSHQSWKCSECNRESFTVSLESYSYEYIFVDPKVIRDNPSIFFLDDGMHTLLTVRNDRWKELFKHKKDIKGISTNPVVVLEEKYVEYPELEEPEKFEW